ncbi:MAG TPA: flagellar FlbD family protein [Bacillota bacterium]|nr:flagellar FlbD family protein [Bacillota bacterium]
MIQLTRLNGETFYINVMMIEQIQSFPDTTITLTNGKKFVVKDAETDVVKKINDYYSGLGLIGARVGEGNE